MMLRRREQVIVDLKTRLFFRAAIRAADVRKKIELKSGRGFEKRANLRDHFARHNHGNLAKGFDDFADPRSIRMLQRRHQRRRRSTITRRYFCLSGVRVPLLLDFVRHFLSLYSAPDPNLLPIASISSSLFQEERRRSWRDGIV